MAAQNFTGITYTRGTSGVGTSKSQVETNLVRKLKGLSSVSKSHCIYRIPEKLRKGNEEAYPPYTPQEISIGPYHCKRDNLYGMHYYKLIYLESFLQRTNENLGTYVKKAEELEGKVREYYNVDIGLDSDEMVEMIVTDGVFLVEFLIRIAEGRYKDDDIFRKPSLRDDIIHDLILLENQLPLFVLKALFNVCYTDDGDLIIRIYILSTQYFSSDPRLVKTILRDQSLVLPQMKDIDINTTRHLLDFFYNLWVTKLHGPISATSSVELSSSATELQEAGIRLQPVQHKILTGIQSSRIWLTKDGTLEIPKLLVNRHTESIFRNVIAYEHCHRKDPVFCSYVIFMDRLINTPNDVNLLVKVGIITNSLGGSEHVCTLFNTLYNISMINIDDFCYAGICKDLNIYSSDRWHQWKAAWFRARRTLRSDYCRSPWKIISIIAGVMLLCFTAIQTACAIKSTKW